MNKDINEKEERQELYNACKKQSWIKTKIDKISKSVVDSIPDDATEKDLEKAANKIINKGFTFGVIIGVLCVLLITFLFRFKYLFGSFDRFGIINDKLNEINYYMDKYALYEKDNFLEIEDKLCDAYMKILSDDKYSYYYDRQGTLSLVQSAMGEYTGIGILVSQEKDTKRVLVSYIYKGSSAPDEGIEIDDEIIKVEDIDVNTLELEELSNKVKGKEGTTVKLTIVKPDGTEKEVEVTRKKIIIEEVYSEVMDNNIGYIQILEFEGKVGSQLAEIKNDFMNKGIKGLIIDLRGNPGGGLNNLLDVSNLFLEDKLVTYFENGDGSKEEYFAKGNKWEVPVVILVNENTASAAEAFSGAMQDYKNAILVGTETFGKGIVQNVYKLHDGTFIKFTASKYYTPNGRNFDKNGIKPDFEVELDVKNKIDTQLNKAKELLKEKISKEGDYKWD